MTDCERLAQRALEAYLGGRAARILHASRKRVVALVAFPEGEVVVKHYRPFTFRSRLKSLIARPPYLRAREAAARLAHLDFETPEPLGQFERERGEGFLVTAALSRAPPLDRYFLSAFTRTARLSFRRRFLAALAGEVRSLHERRVYQADLKTCNILVREGADGGFRFVHVDLDDVRFDRPVALRERLYNLAQLHSSTPRAVTYAERLRFFLRVLGRESLDAQTKRDLRRLLAVSRRRGLVFFGFDGPLEQSWTPGAPATRPGVPRD